MLTERRFSPLKLVLGALAGVMGFMCLCLMCVIALLTPTEPVSVDVIQVTVPVVAAAVPIEPGYTRPASTIPVSSSPTAESVLAQAAAALVPAGEQALVVRVIDGDTIEVESDKLRLHLHGYVLLSV